MGALKNSPELDLINIYLKRFSWDIQIKELEIKKKTAKQALKSEEGKIILSEISPGAFVITLDEHGKQLSSVQFAAKIKDLQIQSIPSLSIIIGGADGLSQEVNQKANLVLALGEFTWPHMLARVMIIEQLYRAQQILKGHPYHRE